MRTKTFRAQNMMAALQDIQREMGPNAIVLSMREIPTGPAWQVWNKTGVEVVATTELPSQSLPQQTKKQTEEVIPGRKEIEDILNAIADRKGFTPTKSSEAFQVRREAKPRAHLGTRTEPAKWTPPSLNPEPELELSSSIDLSMTDRLGDLVDEIIQGHQASEQAAIPEQKDILEGISRKLTRQGLNSIYIKKIMDANRKALSPVILQDDERLTRYVKQQLEASLKPQKNSMAIIPSRIMCLIGATGSGKTSTCAKLAAFYTRTMGKKVVWVCADTIRAGAIAETRTYTDVLEIPLFFAYTPQELGEIVNSQTDADLVLVDTPGVNMLDEDKVLELGTYLSQISGRSIYLTAPATTKLADLLQAVSTFSPFNLKGFIVTKMDETYAYGELFNLMHETKMPLMYITHGTQVVGKIRPGDPAALIDAIFAGGFHG